MKPWAISSCQATVLTFRVGSSANLIFLNQTVFDRHFPPAAPTTAPRCTDTHNLCLLGWPVCGMRAALPDQRRLEKDDLTISCTVTWPLSSAPLTSVRKAAPKNFTSRKKKKGESEREETSYAHKINSFTFSEWINTNNFASHIHEYILPKLPPPTPHIPQIFLRVRECRSTLE